MQTTQTKTKDLEPTFSEWAKPPGKTEQDRCDNAVGAIRNAIQASAKLRARQVTVFPHGSYHNRTNIPGESDVDVGVVCKDTFFHNSLPQGYESYFTPATYRFEQFKQEVGEALVTYFGANAVNRDNKAFKLRENSYRVDADCAPFFEYRRYDAAPPASPHYGVALVPDNPPRNLVINYPTQHYDNGCAKNERTGKNYKGVARILKNLRVWMEEHGHDSAKPITGFLIECLLYNVPDALLIGPTWTALVTGSLAYLVQNTASDETCGKWTEVSGLKWLLSPEQKWTREQVHEFVRVALSVVT